MEGERGVLQDRIEAAALGLGRDAREGIGGEDDEEQEGDGDAGLHGQHVGAQRGAAGWRRRARQRRRRRARISTHSSIEPSWFPHTPEIL